jgi:hypothetical protein
VVQIIHTSDCRRQEEATYTDGDLDGDGAVTQEDLDLALAQFDFGIVLSLVS